MRLRGLLGEQRRRRRAPFFFRLWGIPFILVGLYAVAGRFVHKRLRRRRTAYALTTRRAIVVEPRTQTDSPLTGIPMTIRHSRDRRHATVTFGAPGRARSPYPGLDLMPQSTAGGTGAVVFQDVADPERLLQALSRARTS